MPAVLLTSQFIWLWCLFLFVLVFGCGIGAYKLKTYLELRKIRELEYLRGYRKRLDRVVSELLSVANEMDQATKYLSNDSSELLSAEIGRVCNELVQLSEALPLIDSMIESENYRAGKDGVLRICVMASKISEDISSVKAENPKLIVDTHSCKKPKTNGQI